MSDLIKKCDFPADGEVEELCRREDEKYGSSHERIWSGRGGGH